MVGKRVEIEGAQYLDRREGGSARALHQQIKLVIDDDAVLVEVTGSESGRLLPVPSSDPAVIRHYRALDHAQLAVAIVERAPAPEPRRVPIDPRGNGLKTCTSCNGVGMVDIGDRWDECSQCHGDGVIPIDNPES